jgi:uncharacterized protein (DUF952 family)
VQSLFFNSSVQDSLDGVLVVFCSAKIHEMNHNELKSSNDLSSEFNHLYPPYNLAVVLHVKDYRCHHLYMFNATGF